MSNSFGHIFRFTSFGESHGTAIGGVIDGCPAGIQIDFDFIQSEMERRRPGQSKVTTQRAEKDEVQFLSGLFEGKTTGAPIAFLIANSDQRSSDYEHLKHVFRPSHADFTYQEKYGVRDYRGGGRASARETAVRVVVGAIAKFALRQIGVEIKAYTSQIGDTAITKNYCNLDLSKTDSNAVRCPDEEIAEQMIARIGECQKQSDSIGGIVTCVIKNVPCGLGEPTYGKLHAELAYAMMSINAAKGFDYGSGFENVALTGKESNDEFCIIDGKIATKSNFSGGIQGGISNGQDIYFRVAFKPTPTIAQRQKTIDDQLHETALETHGRHDACVVPRAVPVVEAMAAIVLFDAYLQNRCSKI